VERPAEISSVETVLWGLSQTVICDRPWQRSRLTQVVQSSSWYFWESTSESDGGRYVAYAPDQRPWINDFERHLDGVELDQVYRQGVGRGRRSGPWLDTLPGFVTGATTMWVAEPRPIGAHPGGRTGRFRVGS